MSKNFYTNVQCVGNNILFRGIVNGKRVDKRIKYQPSLYLPSKVSSHLHSLSGEALQQKEFTDIREARDFVKQYNNISGINIYGNTRYEYSFIADEYRDMVEYDKDLVKLAITDIEVNSSNGFPEPSEAAEPITAITLHYIGGRTYVFGCKDYTPIEDELYIKCRDETDMCWRFLDIWTKNYPDAITGWNTDIFDIPYITNRFRKILGIEATKRLSPWGIISERTIVNNDKEMQTFRWMGVASLDYIALYKWYAPNGKSQENYRLNTIANVELGEGKLSYEEYGSLDNLYEQDFQKYIEYNIKDVKLILRLDEKLDLLELAMAIAYDTKSNFEDVFAQTRMWDSITYSYLLNNNIIVPPKSGHEKNEAFKGAYVKMPQIGLFDWVASFDLNSLYPHLIMQYNISPETLIEPENYTQEMRNIISQGVTVEKMLCGEIDLSALKDLNVTMTPNGQFFRRDIQGFLPKILEGMYEDRKKFKNIMLDYQQKYEDSKDEADKFELSKLVSKYNNLQLAKKVGLNSAYGVLGSQYFRFFDLRLALAVTTAGQLSIRWIENELNTYMNNLLGTDDDYVIASDTDSIYLKLGPLVDKVYSAAGKIGVQTNKIIDFMDRVCDQKIQPVVDKSYKNLAEYTNAYAQKMRMKREVLANKGIWTAKKRYVLNVHNSEGVAYAEPHMKIMGLEVIKSSTPSAVRENMYEAIRLMVNGTEEDVQNYIEQCKQNFKKLPPEDIAFPRGIRGIDKYSNSVSLYGKGTPIHVKGAIHYNKMLKEKGLNTKYPYIQEGEKIKFSYLKTPNPMKDTVISFPIVLPKEFELHRYIDYDTQFEKSFIEPIKIILDCIGWQTEKHSTLEDFFS